MGKNKGNKKKSRRSSKTNKRNQTNSTNEELEKIASGIEDLGMKEMSNNVTPTEPETTKVPQPLQSVDIRLPSITATLSEASTEVSISDAARAKVIRDGIKDLPLEECSTIVREALQKLSYQGNAPLIHTRALSFLDELASGNAQPTSKVLKTAWDKICEECFNQKYKQLTAELNELLTVTNRGEAVDEFNHAVTSTLLRVFPALQPANTVEAPTTVWELRESDRFKHLSKSKLLPNQSQLVLLVESLCRIIGSLKKQRNIQNHVVDKDMVETVCNETKKSITEGLNKAGLATVFVKVVDKAFEDMRKNMWERATS